MTAAARPARVLSVIVDLPVGGAEEHLLSLVRNLDPARFAPVVCCIGRSGPIGREIAAAGCRVLELGKLRTGGFDREIVALLRGTIRREGADLVHSHLYHANLYGRLAAFREGVPAVASVHNTYVRHKLHRRLLNRWLGRRTPRILAGSEAIKADVVRYDGVPAEKVVVVPYGIDTDRFALPLSREAARAALGLPPGRIVLGTVGRLEEQKGQGHLVAAMGILRRRGLTPLLLLVGSGREEEGLRRRVAAEGLEDDVRFLGTRRDLPELFRAMDLFVLPSLWEGLPLALLSAMAAGLPVVATSVGGIPEAVRDGESGYLVPPGDAEAIAGAVERAIRDPASAAACGAAARDAARARYSHRTTAERIMAIYDEVLSGGGGAGAAEPAGRQGERRP